MYDDILNPAGWATCNDAVALIKKMGPMFGHPEYNGEYPVRPTENGMTGKGAIIESVYTVKGSLMGQTIPAVTSGTIFLGNFNAFAAITDPMATTEFGILFEDKPLTVTGWLKYTPGTDFYDENGNIIDQQDLGTVNAVLYEVTSEDETLNGSNIYTSEAICATGSFETDRRSGRIHRVLLRPELRQGLRPRQDLQAGRNLRRQQRRQPVPCRLRQHHGRGQCNHSLRIIGDISDHKQFRISPASPEAGLSF